MTITKEEFFKPGRMSAQEKASATNQAAKQIIATEAAQRARKTEHLRQLREAHDAQTIVPSSVRRKKPAVSGRK